MAAKAHKVTYTASSFTTDRGWLGVSSFAHVVKDDAGAIIAYKSCDMTIQDPCVSGNVQLDATVDSNYIINYLSTSNTKVPLYTSLDMKFINE